MHDDHCKVLRVRPGLPSLVLGGAALTLVPVSVVVGDVDRKNQVLQDAAQAPLLEGGPEVFAQSQLEDCRGDNLDNKKTDEDSQGVAKADGCPFGELRWVFIELLGPPVREAVEQAKGGAEEGKHAEYPGGVDQKGPDAQHRL